MKSSKKLGMTLSPKQVEKLCESAIHSAIQNPDGSWTTVTKNPKVPQKPLNYLISANNEHYIRQFSDSIVANAYAKVLDDKGFATLLGATLIKDIQKGLTKIDPSILKGLI
jgi:hypothetical protein